MAERDDQRNQRRTDADCEDPVSLPSRKNPPQRADKDCDTPADPPLADQFTEPVSCPPQPAPTLVVPDPLVIGNDEVTAECPLLPDKPGTVGDPVTVDADTFRDFFNFGSIDEINTNQLTYIAGLSTAQRAQLADPSTPVSTIQTITKLNTAQATFINEQVTAIKDSVNAVAQASAEGQLTCLFFNTEQTVTCDDAGFPADAYTNATVPAGEEANVSNPSTVVANVYSSPSSQEEADEIAENVAQSALKCYYGNDEVTATCLDIGFGEAVPNDTAPALSSDGRLRVGSVTIAADTIFSNAGKDVATDLATTLAEAQLVCFYLNAETYLDCASQGKEGTVAPPADVLAGVSGNPVLVPAGYVQSTVNTADANTQALLLAQSLLDCYWVNEQQCKECDLVEVTNPDDPDGPPFYVTAQDPGPRCISAGSVRSYVSQADANAQALILAEAQLICIYCNPTIYPKCAPPSWSGTIPVPPDEIDSSWSVSATRGAAEGTICSTDATDTIGVAVSIGNTPADIADASDCCYGNDAVTAACENDAGGFPPDPDLSSDEVVIAANTIIICDSDAAEAGWVGTTKDYATQLAQQLAEAALVCIWANAEVYVTCPLPGGDDILVGASEFTVPAGLYISFRSQAEADDIAETVGLARLNCVYGNYGGEGGGSGSYPGAGAGNCSEGETFLGQPTMATASVQSSVSSAAASALAEQMSDAAAVCADSDLLGGGQPGNDGSQTGCSGNCYGYYS